MTHSSQLRRRRLCRWAPPKTRPSLSPAQRARCSASSETFSATAQASARGGQRPCRRLPAGAPELRSEPCVRQPRNCQSPAGLRPRKNRASDVAITRFEGMERRADLAMIALTVHWGQTVEGSRGRSIGVSGGAEASVSRSRRCCRAVVSLVPAGRASIPKPPR